MRKKITPEDSKLIKHLARRASLYRRAHKLPIKCTIPGFIWMLEVAKIKHNINLPKLYSFDDFNFAHDMFGLYNCMECDGTLRKNFWPRCGSVK